MKKIIKKIKHRKSAKIALILFFVFLGFVVEKLHLTKLILKIMKGPTAAAQSYEMCYGLTSGDSSTGDKGDGGNTGGIGT